MARPLQGGALGNGVIRLLSVRPSVQFRPISPESKQSQNNIIIHVKYYLENYQFSEKKNLPI